MDYLCEGRNDVMCNDVQMCLRAAKSVEGGGSDVGEYILCDYVCDTMCFSESYTNNRLFS